MHFKPSFQLQCWKVVGIVHGLLFCAKSHKSVPRKRIEASKGRAGWQGIGVIVYFECMLSHLVHTVGSTRNNTIIRLGFCLLAGTLAIISNTTVRQCKRAAMERCYFVISFSISCPKRGRSMINVNIFLNFVLILYAFQNSFPNFLFLSFYFVCFTETPKIRINFCSTV